MGVFTYTLADINSPVAPSRLFHFFALDNHIMLPKVLPEFVKSIEFVQGDTTSVGCIKQMNLPEGSPYKYVKHRVDEIDTSKFYIKYTSIEGDVLRDVLECVVYEHKYEPTDTGCQYKNTATYHTKGDYVMKDEEIAAAKQAFQKMFKAAEAYLIANPQVYA